MSNSKYIIDGHEVLFDSVMKPFLDIHAWYVQKSRNTHYAFTSIVFDGKQHSVSMHRVLTGMSRLEVDHINGNGLDNRRANLRLASRGQNAQNAKIHRPTQSPYRGVIFNKAAKKWCASINVNGKRKHLGSFKTEIEAAVAYDKASLEFHGEFGRRNFPAVEGGA